MARLLQYTHQLFDTRMFLLYFSLYTLHTLAVGFILLHLTHFTSPNSSLHITSLHMSQVSHTYSKWEPNKVPFILAKDRLLNQHQSFQAILSLAIKYVFPYRFLGYSINMWLRLTYGECSRDCVRSQFESHFNFFFFNLEILILFNNILLFTVTSRIFLWNTSMNEQTNLSQCTMVVIIVAICIR